MNYGTVYNSKFGIFNPHNDLPQFSFGKSTFASYSRNDKNVYIWSYRSAKSLNSFNIDLSKSNPTVEISSDGAFLATVTRKCTLEIFDVLSGELLFGSKIAGARNLCFQSSFKLMFARDNQLLYVIADSGIVSK